MYYRDIDHFKNLCGYAINGIWYPRVTKILDVKSKPALENFFKEVGDYSAAESVKNKSAEEGSLVHGVIEKILRRESFEIPESVKPAIDAFLKFKERSGVIFFPEFVERRIWSPKHCYAGTVDALVLFNGKFGVLDVKTSSGFWPEYNLQTAAYVSALQEFEIKKLFSLPENVSTRWILKIDQFSRCGRCGSVLRQKGGRRKIRNGKVNGAAECADGKHEWRDIEGDVEMREFPYLYKDTKAFMAAKILWEWENEYWLKRVGYLTRLG